MSFCNSCVIFSCNWLSRRWHLGKVTSILVTYDCINDRYLNGMWVTKLCSNEILQLLPVRVLAMALCLYLSVCLSVTSRSSIETDEWIELVLAWSFVPPILHCVKKKFSIYKNKGTSLWNFVPNSGLRKFCFVISIVETCCQPSWSRWTLRAW